MRPLGVFGPRNRAELDLDRATLLAQGTLEASVRDKVAAYLRSGTLVLALMEYTTDVVNAAFGVSGGSGIMTDGNYYWRVDAADYIEHYGFTLDEEILDWMKQNSWNAPPVSEEKLRNIDAELFARLRSREG